MKGDLGLRVSIRRPNKAQKSRYEAAFIIIGAIGLASIVWSGWRSANVQQAIVDGVGEIKIALGVNSQQTATTDFRLAVTTVLIKFGYTNTPTRSRVLVYATIENRGSPSIAKNLTLEIEVPGRQLFQASRLLILADPTVDQSRSLTALAGNQELKGAIDGYELFETTPLSCADLSNPETRYTLLVQDKFSKSYSGSIRVIDIPGLRGICP